MKFLVSLGNNHHKDLCYRCLEGMCRYAFRSKKCEEELPVHDFADRLAYELKHKNVAKEHACLSIKTLSPLSLQEDLPGSWIRLMKEV
jgi:hypothetical protein